MIFKSFDILDLSIKDLIFSVLPITFKSYWFMTVFVVLYCLIPFINKLLNSLNREDYKKVLLVGLLLFSILPTFTTKDFYGNELIQLMLFYSIGAYFGKYNDTFFSKKKNCILVLFSMIVIILGSIVCIDLLSLKFSVLVKHSTYLLNRNSIFSILLCIALFNLFVNKKPFSNNIINGISKNVLAVYLISDNYLIRKILWTDILKVSLHVDKWYLFGHMILSVLIVFIVCIIIEWIRSHTIEKLFSKIYDGIYNKISYKSKKVM